MRDYLLPPDDELALFFQDYAHLITVMTNETLPQDLRSEHSCPILIMATQRYINLSREELQRFLVWDGGYRSLIVIDEQPHFKQQVDISELTFGIVEAAIRMGIPDNQNTREDKDYLIENWGIIKNYFDNILAGAKKAYDNSGMFYRWQRINWNAPELYDRIITLLRKYKQQLNDYLMSREYEDIFTLVKAIHQILTVHGGLFQIKVGERRRKKARISVLLDNINNFLDLSAKVVILDGTADIEGVSLCSKAIWIQISAEPNSN